MPEAGYLPIPGKLARAARQGQEGDRIRLSVAERRLDLLVAPEELARRPIAPPPVPERGYALLYRREILQADRGCDFNFLRKHPLDAAER
jgi:dihydroxy-acid dehydratase